MTIQTLPGDQRPSRAFRHEALLYAGQAEFLDRTAAFIREGLDADEPTLVVVGAAKIDILRSELGEASAGVRFANMAEVGANPARIIPAWREFVEEHGGAGRRLRGVGEPIWAGRSPEELVECERHEALLNVAFVEAPAWWLLCPYDVEALPRSVVEEAARNHPFVSEGGMGRASSTFRGLSDAARPLEGPLPEPEVAPVEISFDALNLDAVRRFVDRHAFAFGLDATRAENLVLAADELATNSVRHGGGGGVVRVWRSERSVNCEIRDGGRFDDPLAGRERPTPSQESGFGLWLANHLCDLVQVRSFAAGSVVRLHVWLG